MRSNKAKETASKIALYVVLMIVSVTAVFPFYWMVKTSIESPEAEGVFTVFPERPTLDAYFNILHTAGTMVTVTFRDLLVNSLFVAAFASVLVPGLCIWGAYALGRMNFRGKGIFLRSTLATYMVPSSLIVLPFFMMILNLGLYDNLISLVIATAVFNLPYSIWVFSGYLGSIPRALDEAALMDGCSRAQAIVRVILPISAPGLVAIALNAFVEAWNEYLYVVVLITSQSKFTLPVGVMSFLHTDIVYWNGMMAMSVLYSIPPMIFFVFIQRFLIQGLTRGAVKG